MPSKKKAAVESETVSGAEIRRRKAADFRSLYANSAQVRTSFYDVSLVFGEISPEGDSIECEEHVQIVMSPQHAKVMLQILDRNLRTYEERFGVIDLPEGIA
jgi:Protein of unknown function (DUF3467)